jgi:hypothetical protein
MEIKREVFLLSMLIIAVFLTNLVCAIDLDVRKEIINDVIIKEIDKPARFELTIKNLGESDSFVIYSLVNVEISPKGSFRIESGETKILNMEVWAGEDVRENNNGFYTFVYKIKGSNTGTQEQRLTIKLVELEKAIELSSENINPNSEQGVVKVKNRENFDFENIEGEFVSTFFSFNKNFSLAAFGEKSFSEQIDKEILEKSVAGQYILDGKIKVDGTEKTLKSTIKFLERTGIATDEKKEGWLLSRYEIVKKNEGNLPKTVEIVVEKNILSRLFTSFNKNPDKVDTQGLKVLYSWRQELRPSESIEVIVKTNWIIPLMVVVAVILIIIFVKIYMKSDVELSKKIGFVKTKGGEFALKITLKVKAKRYVERVSILDKLPPIVRLYERYGAITPDRVDKKNKRLEWNLESLDQGEERIFSYVVYSKIGIVGRFELPPARGVYEREGKVKETTSNKVFFESELKEKQEE